MALTYLLREEETTHPGNGELPFGFPVYCSFSPRPPYRTRHTDLLPCSGCRQRLLSQEMPNTAGDVGSLYHSLGGLRPGEGAGG